MGNSWKYAQVLQFPQSDLCECGHTREYHNNKTGWCYKCPDYKKLPDISASPPDDVLDTLLIEQDRPSWFAQNRDSCEKFRHWSIERVRAFLKVYNIMLWSATGMEQTLIDDYLPVAPAGFSIRAYPRSY